MHYKHCVFDGPKHVKHGNWHGRQLCGYTVEMYVPAGHYFKQYLDWLDIDLR